MSMILMVLASGLVPLTDPGSWISSDDYPAEARRSSETGTATVSLTVDDGGRPTACNVVASTSSETLDAATCTLLMERARFRRPSDPEQNTTQLRVKWALTPPDLMPVAQGGVIADLAFDAEGDVLDCNERILGSARMFPGNACDFGPQALDKIFGSALQGASGAHFRFIVVPRDDEVISIEASSGHRVLIDLHADVTPSGFAINCQAVQLDSLFDGMNPCDWFSTTEPDFEPEPTRTANRTMRVIFDSWIDPT